MLFVRTFRRNGAISRTVTIASLCRPPTPRPGELCRALAADALLLDLLDEVARLKQADGGDIFIWGTGRLTDALAAAGLLDEYRICTSPVIKGGGEPLFRPASAGTVELLDTKVLGTGAVVHAYRPVSTS